MRVLVMGTGAIGGTVGSRFVLAGDEVVFVARGAHLAAIQARGLTIKSEFFGEYHLPATAVSDPAEMGIADLVLSVCRSPMATSTSASRCSRQPRRFVPRQRLICSLGAGWRRRH